MLTYLNTLMLTFLVSCKIWKWYEKKQLAKIMAKDIQKMIDSLAVPYERK